MSFTMLLVGLPPTTTTSTAREHRVAAGHVE
jgi:hypothetical protein